MTPLPRRHWPVPELLPGARGAGWTVLGSRAAMVQLGSRRMWVPLGADPAEANQRAHEMAHARWTSWRIFAEIERRGLPDDVVRAVEDGRMHARLGAAGIDLSAGILKADELARIAAMLGAARPFPTRLATLLLVSSHGTGRTFDALVSVCEGLRWAAGRLEDPAREAAVAEALTIARQASAMLRARARPTSRETFRIARWIHATLSDRTPLHESWTYLLHGEGRAVDGLVPWGVLGVEEPYRARRVRGASARRSSRPRDSGTLPRAWHRWAIDRAVFAGAGGAPAGGGTVLIDVSGSMGPTVEGLLRVIESRPRATVAAYGGHGAAGVLRVLAREGWRVDDHLLLPVGEGMNVVDGPALEWLARQSAPRLWVSDGGVTGVEDHSGAENTRECETLCRAAGIRKIRSIGGVSGGGD